MTQLQIKPLGAELQKFAIEELQEVPERIPDDLQALKEWLKHQPHLQPSIEDQYLIQYLRSAKYSLEKAKEKLDFWLSIPKTQMIEDVDEPKFRELLKTGSVLPLPMPLNGSGPRILFVRTNFNPQQFSANEFLRYFFAVHTIMLVNDPFACIHGLVYVWDFSELTKEYLLEFTTSFFTKVGIPVLKKTPIRIKGMYMQNLPNFAEYLAKFVMSFMSEKIRKRFLFVNAESLKEVVPQKYLPHEYGGGNGSLDHLILEQAKTFAEHRDYLKRVYECRSNEELRLDKSAMQFNDQLGVEGSFRKLNLD